MTRVLVVDDDRQLTRALAAALGRDGFECVVAEDAASGLEQVSMASPELVVLDLRLPDDDGVEVVKRLRAWSEVPVLILSGVTDQRRRVEALDAGADDFLQKPFGIEELVARMRAVIRRSQGGSERSPQLRFDGLAVDLSARVVTVHDEEVRLTPKEWRLLEVFVSHPGRLLTHTWLLSEVWDDGYGDETRAALRAHVRTLRAKIDDDATHPRFLRTDSGSGYRWIAEELGPEPSGALDDLGPESSSDDEVARISALETGALVHELNNALTALRIAVRILRPKDAGSDDGQVDAQGAAVAVRVDEVLDRVSRLAVEVGQRADGPPEVTGGLGDVEDAADLG